MRPIVVLATILTVAVAVLATAVYLDLIRWQECDVAGGACCGPDSEVKTQHCHKGLGCNITTGKCAPCGAPGQPCCDGDLTGFSLKGYSGFLLDSSERIDSCDSGASCDARLAPDGKSWLGTRLCQACGTKEGGSCCAADVRYALGRCFTDATSGKLLTCNDPWAREKGTCVLCGRWNGDLACLSGQPCDDGLVEKDGFCVSCGYAGMPTCDRGEPCRGGQSVPNRSHSQCVAAGGPNQPCLPTGGCGYDRMFCNAQKLCEPCGEGGQTCCPAPQGTPCSIGECRDNRCFACGYTNMPVCPGNDPCRDGSEPVSGFCRHCGREGERCCYGLSIRCDEGMRCDEGTCRRTGGSAGSGEEWKTCSGQPYTWSTTDWPIHIEDENGCIATVTYRASSPEEALQCARGQYGEAAIGTSVEGFAFAVTCPHTGCNQLTYYGRDHDSAESCVEATWINCTVDDGSCP